MRDLVGSRLGDFEIVRELGRGGMGVVYEARQLSLQRPVALKVLSSGLGLTARSVQRFHREAAAAARLHHTNIVAVYTTGEQDGTYFYAMELIAGPSLDHVLRQLRQEKQEPSANGSAEPRPSPNLASTAAQPAAPADATGPYGESAAPPARDGSGEPSYTAVGLSSSSLSSGSGYFDNVARLVAEVADALDYAHQQGVVHRDIKPSNLLLSPAGRLSVNDFGLARVLEQPGMTMTGEFVGTPMYMSPEQITAGRAPLDHRTDIYSLGATLYELLTLQPPFQGRQRDQVIAQILHKEPKAPRRVNPRVPVDLETICLKALEKDPDRRYQSARALAEDLRRFLQRFAISARRVGPLGRAVKWARRRPALAATLAAALVLALAAIFLAYLNYRTEQQRLADQHQQEERLLTEKRQHALERALLVAMSGDLQAAEKAIQEAERLGVSTGQVRLLRGEVAYYRGRVDEAIQHLQQAVKLLPEADSAGARGLLIVALVYSCRQDEAAEQLRELESIQPVSMEDALFKGAAIGQWDPERGLAILDEVVKQHPSSAIARLFRADALSNLALLRFDPGLANRAIDDAETAKKLLAGTSPVALWQCALTYQQTALVYQAAGLPEKSQQTLTLARQAAESLKPHRHLPVAAGIWAYYHWYFGQKDHPIDELRRLAKKSDDAGIAYMRELMLYARGSPADLQEVQTIAGSFPKDSLLALFSCCAAAERDALPAALEVYQRAAAHKGDAVARVYLAAFPLLLGKTDLSKSASRALREENPYFRPNEQVFLRKVLDFLAGDATEAELLRVARDSSWDRSRAHFFIALQHLAAGDRAGARAQFRLAVDTPAHGCICYDLSMVFLSRLDSTPGWPSWLPGEVPQRRL
jgi:serine/threonine protein kinase